MYIYSWLFCVNNIWYFFFLSLYLKIFLCFFWQKSKLYYKLLQKITICSSRLENKIASGDYHDMTVVELYDTNEHLCETWASGYKMFICIHLKIQKQPKNRHVSKQYLRLNCWITGYMRMQCDGSLPESLVIFLMDQFQKK